MILDLKIDGKLCLNEVNDFGNFHIQCPEGVDWQQHGGFLRISTPAEYGHFWIEIGSIMELAPGKTTSWTEKFNSMLKAVEKFGYYDPAKQKIKAHIKL